MARKSLITAQGLVALATLAYAWDVAVFEPAVSESARSVLMLLAGVATVGACVGIVSASRERNVLAAVGFLVAAVVPTVFAYIGNLLFLGFAGGELRRAAARRRRIRRSKVSPI